MLAIAALAFYALMRYAVGLVMRNRFTATALTFTSLAALALYVLGPAAGARAAGAALLCAIIDVLWKRKRKENSPPTNGA
jgi:hypothetical protein